jgi:hypothetical protein
MVSRRVFAAVVKKLLVHTSLCENDLVTTWVL